MPRRDTATRIKSALKSLKDKDLKQRRSQSPNSYEAALQKCQTDPYVQKACEAAGLDHNDPEHLFELLRTIATASFFRGDPGREAFWKPAPVAGSRRALARAPSRDRAEPAWRQSAGKDE